MKMKQLGNTGIQVSEIGLGAMGISGKGAYGIYRDIDETEALACLRAYVDGGGNFIDTARRYNQSEAHIGTFLKQTGFNFPIKDSVFPEM